MRNRYLGKTDYAHDAATCTGVLLNNLGTPDRPDTGAVRRYLAEFLSDPRVIELPTLPWQCILHGFILRLRPRRSAAAYRKIWRTDGSPLLQLSHALARQLQQTLDATAAGVFRVELAMRYGTPSINSALERLFQANAERLLILPLYPQYSATTTASTFDAVANTLRGWRHIPELRMVTHYHDHPAYITAIADSIRRHQQQHGKPERLVFSFHGLPEHYFLAGDPYHCECHKSARLIAEHLGLPQGAWQLSFQSRFGPRRWLQPYTDQTLKELAASGVRDVQIVCPGFAVDCLETLEEIEMQNRACFLDSGGTRFSYVPALNDSTAHAQLLAELTLQHCSGWPLQPESDADRALCAQRAEQHKAVFDHKPESNHPSPP